ncbi:putative aldouronate transport system substrate-binding protein [Paenibacillus sp. UNC496MF]|uniref:extracellular solute-binding protein n=1 Tax=Paenibacillus sp. UNC496MF TaxID=1502753 RepID=UPI0008EA165F|nr:extracellular solute-binding protein [Paenibacillus sp. UNC496MF]SFJ80428.1 putative aldouronate transport system substrate-binding protein [Paenibacillus sp. UNC496MF]
MVSKKNANKLAIFCMASALVLSACSASDDSGNNGGNGSEANGANHQTAANGATNEAASDAPANAANEAPAVNAGKYETPIDFTIVGQSDPNLKFDEGQSYDKNSVYDAYAEELGINIKNKWIVDSKQYDDKVNLTVASGDLPDLMKVNATQLQQLVENDLVYDLTDVYDRYASENTKKFMTADGGAELNAAKFDGKLMAIPVTDSPYNSAQFLFVRKDWLTKLNLPEPTTMDNLLQVIEGFTKNDPDGNGKNDSYGIIAQKEIYNQAFSFAGLFNGYHAYPGAWVKDASGKLVYGSIQPEMKTALQALQEMYKAGEIDPEFFTKDHTKENELVANDQAGLAFGQFWTTSWPLPSAVVKDNKVTQEWEVYPIPSVDDQPAMTQIGMNSGNIIVGTGVNGYYVVSKESKHPEAAIKLLNKFIDVDTVFPTPETERFHKGKTSDAYWKLNPIIVMSQDAQARAGGQLPKAVEAKDPSMVADSVVGSAYYKDVEAYWGGNAGNWSSWMVAKPHGSLDIMNQYLTSNRFWFDSFAGAPTPTMASKKSVLDQKEQELYTKIITGKAPIGDFDKFVGEWSSLGGEQMTQEVNDWYAKQAK